MTSGARAGLGPRALRADLARTAAVLATAMLPLRLSPEAVRSLRWPLAGAGVGIAAAVAMALAVATELARAAWGSGPVAAAMVIAALVGPPGRVLLGGPPSSAVALGRCMPLLRALDLGGAPLARMGALAAGVPAIVPTSVLGVAAATVLVARGAPDAALAVGAAVVVGALAAVPPALRAGARLAVGAAGVTLRATAARRLAAVGVLAVALPVVQVAVWPVPSSLLHAGPTHVAVGAAAVAAATWIAGDGLVVDARPWLRLQATLVDCGAAGVAVVARAAAAGASSAAAVGLVVGGAAGALAGTDAGLRAGLAATAIAGAVLVVLVLEPDPTAVLARSVAFALAAAPTTCALLSGTATAWLAATLIAVAVLGAAVLARRFA